MLKKIQEEIKAAMANKNKDKKEVLKSVLGKAQLIAKESKQEITDTVIIDAINKELKQLNQTKDSIPTESDLYKSTQSKINMLEEYLPRRLTQDEIRIEIAKLLSKGAYSNFGEKMKIVMSELRGKADNKLISDIVKEF